MKTRTLLFIGIGLGLLFLSSKQSRNLIMKTYQTITNFGLDLIKRLESFKSEIYLDQAGKWTIGYGHLIIPGEKYYPYGEIRKISHDEGLELLKKDTKFAQDVVNSYVKVPLNEKQFNALVSFVFNVGGTAFANSTMLKKLNAGNYSDAANEFDKWNIVTNGGVKTISSGLVARRETEKNLFNA